MTRCRSQQSVATTARDFISPATTGAAGTPGGWPTGMPTLYIWGDADDTVGGFAAEGTVDFIAAPYRFEVLPGVGHFAADQAPERVSELLLQQIAAHPV